MTKCIFIFMIIFNNDLTKTKLLLKEGGQFNQYINTPVLLSLLNLTYVNALHRKKFMTIGTIHIPLFGVK